LIFLLVSGLVMSSRNYYFCSLCVESRPHCEYRELFRHLQYVHNEQSDFKIRCELGPLCGRIYSTFAGYKAHIYREHIDLLDKDLCKKKYRLIRMLMMMKHYYQQVTIHY
jgi:hypothetical protein